MEKIRKSTFIKVALFCLMFLLVCFISVYAITKTKQNERFVLKDITLQQAGQSSRVIVMEFPYEDYTYIVTDASVAKCKWNAVGWKPVRVGKDQSDNIIIAKTLKGFSANFVDGITLTGFRGIMLYVKKLEDVGYIKTMFDYPTMWAVGSEHTFTGNIEFFGYKIASNSEYPLVFKMAKDLGYIYICGCGTVRDKDGKTHKLGYDDTVDKWLPLLKSDDQIDREGATQALGWLAKTKKDKDKAVPALIGALTDKAMEVRRDSAESLGRIGDSRAKETLEKIAKDDKDDWVREVAEESLGLIEVKEATTRLANGDNTAINDLSKALEHQWFLVRRAAVDSLAKAGTEAIDPLITALKNDDYEVRIKSAEALAKIGDKKALEPLNKALTDEKDEDVKRAFEEAIKKLEK